MCNCIEENNRTLRAKNTMLALQQAFDEASGQLIAVLPIPTVVLNSKVRVPKIHLRARFCPFCGEDWMPPQTTSGPTP